MDNLIWLMLTASGLRMCKAGYLSTDSVPNVIRGKEIDFASAILRQKFILETAPVETLLVAN